MSPVKQVKLYSVSSGETLKEFKQVEKRIRFAIEEGHFENIVNDGLKGVKTVDKNLEGYYCIPDERC